MVAFKGNRKHHRTRSPRQQNQREQRDNILSVHHLSPEGHGRGFGRALQIVESRRGGIEDWLGIESEQQQAQHHRRHHQFFSRHEVGDLPAVCIGSLAVHPGCTVHISSLLFR